MRSILVFFVLTSVWTLSRLFYRLRAQWMPSRPADLHTDTRVIAILNHTSLYEPLIAGFATIPLLWKFAHHGVLPVAEKTMKRRIGLFFSMLARTVVVVTRQRDHTWDKVLNTVDDKAIVVILPEGRMKRRDGLDSTGRPMTVRAGIADILEVLNDGRMLLVYSAGLHHIQAPGELLPRFFRTVRCKFEFLQIADYKKSIAERFPTFNLRRAVVADLTQRRDEHCT